MNDKSLKKKFGKFLKSKRKEKSLTQTELGEICGFAGAQFVSNWERGVCLPPPQAMLYISKKLRIRKAILIQKAVDIYRATLERKIR